MKCLNDCFAMNSILALSELSSQEYGVCLPGSKYDPLLVTSHCALGDVPP